MKGMSDRSEAVEWWTSLKPNEQQAMVLKHFHRMEFMLVSMSSDKIKEIFDREKKEEIKNK